MNFSFDRFDVFGPFLNTVPICTFAACLTGRAVLIPDSEMEMADHYIFVEHTTPEQNKVALHGAVIKMRERGAQESRVTAVDLHSMPIGEGQTPHGFFVEGWNRKIRGDWPPFNPPVMYADE